MAKRLVVLLGMLTLALTAALPVAFAQETPQYGGEEVSATGVLVEGLPQDVGGFGTHSISDEATGTLYALRSAGADLASHEGQRVTVYGTLTPGEEGSGEGDFEASGTLPTIDVTRVEPADDPGEGEEFGIQGTVTDISGSTVLVEEDPSANAGDKGYFTVTEETEIGRLVGGDALAPATFEELEVGQAVEAVYAGAVAESYPTQGNAESITILEDSGPPPGSSATFTYELAVECEPPADAAFFGFTAIESLVLTPLSDPDGDGVYTGSQTVPRFAPGGPQEPITISPVRIVQGPPTATGPLGPEYRVIKDFGAAVAENTTFEASVSFCDDDGDGSGDDGSSGGSDDAGNGGGGNVDGGNAAPVVGGDAEGATSGGGKSPGVLKQLPATGGPLSVAGAVGAVLIAGGLIARKITR
ncbi:MAG: YobA family protein [Actinomycetota bacterium]|nr:YobA family protein [Actinomycetota bacterium]